MAASPTRARTAKESVTGIVENPDAEIAVSRFDDDILSGIQSFDDALRILADEGIVIDHAPDVIGNGFAILKDKNILTGVECLVMEWNFNSGEQGEFVSAYVVAKMPGTSSPSRFILNDGGSGIYKQLKAYTRKTGKLRGLHVPRGLTRSDYEKEIDGKMTAATTFYLDTSA